MSALRLRFTCLALWVVATNLLAADVVFVRNSKPGQPPVQRQGEIVDLAGNQLMFRGPSGQVETITLEQVTEWRTPWSITKEQADALYHEKKYAEAATTYLRAREEEQRVWARRQIMMRLIECHSATGNTAAAAEEFLILVASDPETTAWEIAPLAWRAVDDANSLARAAQWIRDTRNPAKQLFGASWLLAGPQRNEAITVLQTLAGGMNKRIATLAVIQLWRTRIITSPPEEPASWLAGLERLPVETGPLGYYCVGEAFARHNQPEKAALAFLRIPILYPRTRPLAAEALLAAAAQLEKQDRREQAAGLYREVLTDHAALPAATMASQRLEQLATPAPKP
jgi:tetratricopeptide (TPR) repeat protein